MLNLDTHIFLFALSDELTTRERGALSKRGWGVSAIVLWEIEKLASLGRIDIDLDTRAVHDALRQMTIWPLSPEVARASVRLDFRSDPADELIAATSLVHQVPLITRDARIRKSKVVPLFR